MIKKIYKFELPHRYKTKLLLNKNAEILAVAEQNAVLCLWVLVDPSAEKEKRVFMFRKTGAAINFERENQYRHIRTFQSQDGVLVYHLFEEFGNEEI